jgi:hypothetical protein
MKRGILALFGVVAVIAAGLIPFSAEAVPSYARQIGKPCTACHTMWPNLNQYGRQFKVKGYTDVDPEWEMINKDNMNMMKTFPVSARVLMYPQIGESTNNQPGAANTLGTNGKGQDATNADQVALFIATRFSDYGGIFTAAEADADGTTNGSFGIPVIKVALAMPIGGGSGAAKPGAAATQGGTLGVVVFKGISTSADPFNSLGGRDRDLSWQGEAAPFILDSGWAFKSDNGDNVGTVVHGYFLGYRLYAAVGTMRGATADNVNNGTVNVTNQASTDPNDFYYRVAWDQKLPNGAVTIGAHYYDGKQRMIIDNSGAAPAFNATPYDVKVKRGYVDVSLEQTFGEDHLLEVQALAGNGTEDNVYGGNENRSFRGSYVQASYFYDRQYGVVASVNSVKYKGEASTDADGGVDKKDSSLVSLNYLPWLNAKLALQYADTKTTLVDGTSQKDKLTRVVMDIMF